MSYTHLQVRSGYSLMNSTITIDKLINQAKKLDFDALALTDEHVLYGVVPFYQACLKNGIKPIIGMIVNVKNETEDIEKFILLAKNNDGYKTLGKLSTVLGMNHKTSLQLEALENQAENIICIMPTGNHTKLRSLIDTSSHEKVMDYIEPWKRAFSDGDFYLGIQDHGLQQEQAIIQSLKRFHENNGIPVTAINDVRYLNEKDAAAFDCLQAMKNGDAWPMRITDASVKNRYFRSSREMTNLFDFWPEVLQETEAIKNKCNVKLDLDQRLLPSFPVPENMGAHDYLEKRCLENVKEK